MNGEISSGDLVLSRIGRTERKGTFIAERDGMAIVKLSSGYNIGLPRDQLSLLARSEAVPAPVISVTQDDSLPDLSIVSTGGTIASRIDYRTGAVTSQFDAEDILRAIPGLRSIARFQARKLYTLLSENMTPAIWTELARAVFEEIKKGSTGVIVTHGTDTMAYSAAALSFMLDTPVPVVFVGSQRSADRPSSDNTQNALCSARAAVSDLGEVVVVMHATTSDDRCSIHRGTRVRKMHSSRRDAFQSIGVPPLGSIEYPSLEVTLSDHAWRRREDEPGFRDGIDDHCALVCFHPGMTPAALGLYSGFRGIVVAGTGLGHVSSELVTALRDLVDDGTIVVMTTQCLHGRVCDRVYDTGRDLIRAGVIEGEDMLPETALVKLMYVLGNSADRDEAVEMFGQDLRGEYTRRSVNGL
jgi:glutamyl-tRNA(Gln) amidotransferase subunit D